jgi:peptidoglycan/LPS O-acetylase OafA/YrhL
LLLFVFVFLSAVDLLPPSLPRSPGTELSYWLFFANWYGPLHPGQGSMTHLWSLSVEEQFYLVWPFVIWRRSATQVRLLCVSIAVLSLCIRVWMLHVGSPTEAIYQFSISRMDALALGGAAAATMRMPLIAQHIWARRRVMFASALIVLLVGAALTGGYAAANPTTMSLGYTLLALDFAAIILLAACADTSRGPGWIRFLGLPWMRNIGKYSYSMYLLHVPLHLLVGLRVIQALGFDQNAPLIVNIAYLLLGTALSYIAAAATYRLIERPFLRLKKQFAPLKTSNALPD